MSKKTKTRADQPRVSVPQTLPKIPKDRIAKLAYEKWMKGGCKHGCDQQAWLEAEAELMKADAARQAAQTSRVGGKRKEFLETFDELGAKLQDEDPEVREVARAKLALYGGESLLELVNHLNNRDPGLRSAARDEFFQIFTNFPFSPKLRKLLESNSIESRVEGIREIVMVLAPVRDAIDAHVPGWESLAALTRSQGSADNPDPPVIKTSWAGFADLVTEDRPMEQTGTVATLPLASTPPSKAKACASRVHLIRIPDREAMKRAVMTLGEVRVAYCGFPDSRLLVANDHIAALQREGIPFDQLS